MERIDFINGTTKGNEETFETLQDNIENAINGIVESGTNDNGEYVKYENGTLICTKSIAGTATVKVWNSPIYYTDIENGNWAYPFSSIHNVQITSRTSQFWTNVDGVTNTSAGKTRLMRPDQYDTQYVVNLFAIGRWK